MSDFIKYAVSGLPLEAEQSHIIKAQVTEYGSLVFTGRVENRNITRGKSRTAPAVLGERSPSDTRRSLPLTANYSFIWESADLSHDVAVQWSESNRGILRFQRIVGTLQWSENNDAAALPKVLSEFPFPLDHLTFTVRHQCGKKVTLLTSHLGHESGLVEKLAPLVHEWRTLHLSANSL